MDLLCKYSKKSQLKTAAELGVSYVNLGLEQN